MTDLDLATVLANHKAGNLAEAEEGYRRILAADPANGEAYHWLGVVACQKGALDLALELMNEARKIRPNDPLLLNNLANALGELNRMEEALRVFDILLEAVPDFPEAHYNRARILAKNHRTDEAIAAYRDAIAWRRDYGHAHYSLACLLEKNGHKAQATTHLLHYLEIEPGDRFGASLKLAAMGMSDMPDRAPFAFMQTLFNGYAAGFDRHLTGRLRYTAPEILAQALAEYWPQLPPDPAAVDIGCGTGLAGAPLRHRLSRLDGVDASPNMIVEARKRGIYDNLTAADLLAWAECGDADYHLAVAADVVVYFGDLEPLFTGVARRLIDGGLFAFTAERATDRAIDLQGSLRYAHAPQYLRDALAASGFTVLSLQEISTRHEAGQPAPGLLAIARRTLSGVN